MAACSFQTLKEDAKHYSLRELAVLRRAILAVDRRFRLEGTIFWLTFEELEALADADRVGMLQSIARERQTEMAQVNQSPPASATLTVVQIENYAAGMKAATADAAANGRVFEVAGSGVVEGRSCVVWDDDAVETGKIPNFRDGDIVVSRIVPPAGFRTLSERANSSARSGAGLAIRPSWQGS